MNYIFLCIHKCDGKYKCGSHCTNQCARFGLHILLQIYSTLCGLRAANCESFAGEILNNAINRRGTEKRMG